MNDDFEIIDMPIREISVNVPEVVRSFKPLLESMQANADTLLSLGPLLHTDFQSKDEDIIFKTFVSGMPIQDQPIANCRTCRNFLRCYGNLCIVKDDGRVQPLLWPEDLASVPQYFQDSIRAVLELFEGGKLCAREQLSIRANSETVLGTPTSKDHKWLHFNLRLPENCDQLASVGNAAAKASHKAEMLHRIVADNDIKTINRAQSLLDIELAYGSNHKLPIRFIRTLFLELQDVGNNSDVELFKNNLIMREAAKTHLSTLSPLRSGILSVLFEDIRENKDLDSIKRRWNKLAGPLNYLRPTAAPTAGNVDEAEKTLESIGLTSSDLERYFLTIREVPEKSFLWTKQSSQDKPPSCRATVFDRVRPAEQQKQMTEEAIGALPKTKISLVDFVKDVLPTARRLEYHVPKTIRATFFTRGNRDAKPTMTWHNETNSAAWYYWGKKLTPWYANLKSGWVDVLSIITFPHMWEDITPEAALERETQESDGFTHRRLNVRYLICLRGVEENHVRMESGLFPTLMRHEFHGIRKTIEAYSRSSCVRKAETLGAIAGGIAIDPDLFKGSWKDDLLFRVRTEQGGSKIYTLDSFYPADIKTEA